jgi:hypothetical protein
MSPSSPTARLRGAVVGLLTAALAVAAHGLGSATPPSGSAVALLTVVAAVIGTLAATIRRAAEPGVLLALLTAGQLLGHLLLSAVGHDHGQTGAPPAAVMVAAHALAIGVGALLVAAGDRLGQALSRVIRAATRVTPLPAATTLIAPRRTDQPMLWTLLLSSCLSHRGPPVSLPR